MNIQPVAITIPDAILDDLAVRLADTRLPPPDATPAFLRDLLQYWRTQYDWRVHEEALQSFHHYTSQLGGSRVHFIHERGRGERPLPIILTHGFPDSFLRFLKIIPLLVDPAAYGGDSRDAFDVIVPSLPGFGFSERLDRHVDLFHIADRWHDLMTVTLGYSRYGAHGGDWGSTITEHLARSYGGHVVGIHLTDVPYWHALRPPKDPSEAEREYLAAIEQFQRRDGSYAMIQGAHGQTLADGLTDSPAGLAAWLVQFFEEWSDCNGDVENRFTKDELLTNVMLYWSTGSIATAFGPYDDVMHAGKTRWILEAMKELVGTTARVPAGFAMFPKDISHPPREWAERFYNVTHWTEMPSGGHFTAHEEPELLAEDLRAFFRPLRD